MIHASCNQCGASFDVTSKAPGARFQCPKCRRGTIAVPADDAPVEELDPSLEVAAEPAEAAAAEAPPSAAPRPARAGGVRAGASRSGARAGSARTGGKVAAAAPPKQRQSKALLAGIVIAIALAAAGYFATRGGESGGAGDSGGSTATGGGPAAGAEAAAANGAAVPASLGDRRAALAPDDAEGRVALAAEFERAGKKPERLALLREALLLDAEHAGARTALGFQRYQGPAARYQGRWLDAADLTRAIAAESLGNPSAPSAAGSGGSSSAAASDPFVQLCVKKRASMQDEFPDGEFEYRYDTGNMPRPYLAAIQKGPGAEVDQLEKDFGAAFRSLYTVFFDRYRERFELADVDEPVPVVVFGSRGGYDNWQARHPRDYPTSQNIGAYYIPGKRQLMLWREGGTKFIGTLFHEGTHQLLDFVCNVNFQSPWFQEGFAEFFNGHKIEQVFDAGSGKLVPKYVLGQLLPERHAILLGFINSKNELSVHDLVHLDYGAFRRAEQEQATDPDQRRIVQLVYAEGWALIMYLHYAEGGKYLTGFEEFFEAEANGEASGDVFGTIFGLDDDAKWAAFHAAFAKWVTTDLRKL